MGSLPANPTQAVLACGRAARDDAGASGLQTSRKKGSSTRKKADTRKVESKPAPAPVPVRTKPKTAAFEPPLRTLTPHAPKFGWQPGRHDVTPESDPRLRGPSRPLGSVPGPSGRDGRPVPVLDAFWGVPHVTRVVEYGDVLRDVRLGRVAEIRYLRDPEIGEPMGQALVAYHDGSLAQARLGVDDFRLAYAMETHGVKATVGEQPLTPAEVTVRESRLGSILHYVTLFGGVTIVGLIYIATWIARQRKGDAEDREKIRQQAIKERKARERQQLLDSLEEEILHQYEEGKTPEFMVDRFKNAGIVVTVEEVRTSLLAAGVDVSEEAAAEDVDRKDALTGGVFYNAQSEEQLEDEEEYRQRVAEEAAEEDPNSQAEGMLRMKSARIKRAQDPARQRRIREAQRQLRGVKLQYSDADTIFFDDVAGIDDAKLELQEVVDFFTRPERFRASGAKVPRGVLLCGPPGTGKTLLARAVAGEAGAGFLSINASEFVEMFVGVGAARCRDLFATARSMAPAILFIDEIDSVGRARGGSQGNDERDQTLNQLLTEMDGFDTDAQVIVMAASNRRDVLDPALVRPGRFDRIVHVGLPDFFGRIDILKVHLDRRPWDRAGVDLHALAFETRNYSGAKLANLVNAAATIAGQRADAKQRLLASTAAGGGDDSEKETSDSGVEESTADTSPGSAQDAEATATSAKPKAPAPRLHKTQTPRRPSPPAVVITMDDLEAALDIERLGAERSRYSDVARRRLAAVEAATATLCTLLPSIEPVKLVTLVTRESYPLGHTVVKTNEARELSSVYTRRYLAEQLLCVLAGRVVEELEYGQGGMSTVCQRRIGMARRIANKMVVSNAMTDAIGPRLAAMPSGPGDDMNLVVTRFMPTHVANAVISAMEDIMADGYKESKAIVRRNLPAIHAIMDALMEKDTLSGDEVRELVERHGYAEDLDKRRREAADFM